MLVSEFDFNLPKDQIALHPVIPRDSSKLLQVNKDKLQDCIFSDLPSLLKEGDVLVFNNTKVIPARLVGKRKDANVEVTLHEKMSPFVWKAFAKPARKLNIGDIFKISEDFEAEVSSKNEGEVTLKFNVGGFELFSKINEYGQMPLPPYIQRDKGATNADNDNYQTIYAKTQGAVAAPTAGLHFTEEVLQKLDVIGVKKAFVTLHVGAGTFLPVKAEYVKGHKMHSEYCVIDEVAADLINSAKQKGGRVIAVGTTSLRVLESVSDDDGFVEPFAGKTDIFITPGYKFKIVDILLTNFHLPKSTLIMLVSAFCGLDIIKKAYAHAIENKYRFYSYGDACLLFKNSAQIHKNSC